MQRSVSTLSKVLIGSVPIIAVLVAAAFFTPTELSLLERQILLGMIAVGGIAFVERLLFGPDLPRVISAMGLTIPQRNASVVALLCSLPMWLFLPAYSLATSASIAVNNGWFAVLAGIILVNGIAEEVIHRAFVFGHLRRIHSFAAAATIGAIIFGLQHSYLLATIGPIAGTASVVLAILLVWPLAFLFERGGNSILPPAIMHTSSNAPIMIFVAPETAHLVILPHMAVVLSSMYLSFALFPRTR
ncbi:CPBP family intramembrane metalloprotease [Aminobacter anthyllidis]|uniref:CPBP family intramembrane metalloprotease n=1 Tax=Aminobacter anthyllidis TaxID=1035067 RepID=A0A9X1D538_9HYPH|nr:CPBP family intramembrane glutamic endopeptidase [Aminobacter anthyllidis]MBT1155566.1 CPBP family intramembrane metalloprotease [Aminobacter anthyllidis]